LLFARILLNSFLLLLLFKLTYFFHFVSRMDTLGNFFYAGGAAKRIFKISAVGNLVTTYAGTLYGGSTTENILAPAVSMTNDVVSITGDSLGNLYYVETCRIRKILPNSGLVSTIIGTNTCGYSGENIAALSTKISPFCLWMNTAGDIIFGDNSARRVRQWTSSTGLVATIAGNGTYGFSNNRPATSAMLKFIADIVGDTNGNIYFSDYENYRVRKITVAGIITTVAGSGLCCGFTNGALATSAAIIPYALELDSAGKLYFSSLTKIAVVDPSTALISTFAGSECSGFSGDDGPATSACIQVTNSAYIFIDSNSNFYFSQDYSDFRIRKVSSSNNIITTFAGNGFYSFGGDGGPAKMAHLNRPQTSFVDSNGNVYIADNNNCRIRVVDPTGIISTLGGSGGTGSCTSTGDNGLFSLATFYNPTSIWKDTSGNLYISESSKLRKVTASTNIITTVAGGGGSTADNILATSYSFWGIAKILGDTVNNIYIVDSSRHNVKKMSLTTNFIITVAGTGSSGTLDNVPATSGQLNYPRGIWVNSMGIMFIADTSSNRIRKVENDFITTFAGTGDWAFNGNGHVATATSFENPVDVIGDSNGIIYIADTVNNCRIRKISAVNATANIVTTVIGSGSCSSTTVGWQLATAAALHSPEHVTMDTNGDFYVITDNIIRKTVTVCTPTSQPSRQPSGQPTKQPFGRPTGQPSRQPSSRPTIQPSNRPSSQPSRMPTAQPTVKPSRQPSGQPSSHPSQPSCQPSSFPTREPTGQPSKVPSSQPSSLPSGRPSSQPSSVPSSRPMGTPSRSPTSRPSNQPSGHPTIEPSNPPSGYPSGIPTVIPSSQPSSFPAGVPTGQPSGVPSGPPTSVPSCFPSVQPSSLPSSQPSAFPTNRPTCVPTNQPSGFPSSLPSTQPSSQPISVPTSFPTLTPTFQPTVHLAKVLKEGITGFYNIKDSLNDKSGNGNNGKAHGGISFTADRFGSEKSSIEFDGNSGYIEVPIKNPDQVITNFTLSFWIFPLGLLPGTVVFDKSVYLSETCGWSLIYLKDHSFEFSYTIRHSGRRLAVSSNTSSSVLFGVEESDWSHITLVKELQSLKAYRDGQLVNSTSISLSLSESLPYSSLPLVIGTNKEVLLQQKNNRNFSYFSGSLDDIFIYDRALSSEEIGLIKVLSAPTSFPSGQPSTKPSIQPTLSPTMRPTDQPTSFPSGIPTRRPSGLPSSQPTGSPSDVPTDQPTSSPSSNPTSRPTVKPSGRPTDQPSSQPIGYPTFQPFGRPSGHPTYSPSVQPSARPSSCPSSVPTTRPSSQPTSQPTQQPIERPSSVPTVRPLAIPTMIPSDQPSSRPTNQPTSFPSSQPSSQPTKNRFHCTVTDNKFYSPIRDSCVVCPLHSFLNHTGDDTCYCSGGYSQIGKGLTVNCTACSAGEVSFPGSANCTQCQSGFFSSFQSNVCSLCPLNFYSRDSGQTQCTACPAGRSTATLGSASVDQCVSPIPNFTLGFFALFLVVVIFSWYIVFGKFQRVSFERKVKIVTPNIEKCKEVLLSEEEFHYQHLIVVQDKKNQRTRKFKFLSFVVLSIVLMIVSVFLGFVFFTYQVFFTSLILWRGMKVDFRLTPILTLLAEGLKDITEYISLPVNLFYFVALPFLYLFETLATIDLNLSSVNVTCSGSQAPIELLINCFILGLLIIIIRSDYQLLFNILLNNLNQRFLLNNIEQRLDSANFRFSRYFFICLVITALNTMNPFQVGLRYCMGFVRIDTFGKNHGIHQVTESCNQVPGAPNFDSFLGYVSTAFAWWLILPAIYCLAEVVVPKCKKIEPLKWQISKEKQSIKSATIFPADMFVDETIRRKA
jgi:hypothetical protein